MQGPFSAKEIVKWHADEWFGLDLVIRARGAYWTTLALLMEDIQVRPGCRGGFEGARGMNRKYTDDVFEELTILCTTLWHWRLYFTVTVYIS